MNGTKTVLNTIDDYKAGFSADVQAILEALRATISQAAPQAQEKISYQMPTFTLKGNLVHFAAYKHHIGFYPTPSAIDAFKEDLSSYHTAKGSVRFPLDQPLPFELIAKIVAFRVKQNLERAKSGKKNGG